MTCLLPSTASTLLSPVKEEGGSGIALRLSRRPYEVTFSEQERESWEGGGHLSLLCGGGLTQLQ